MKKPKVILVTGAAGFIGSRLAQFAFQEGHEVYAVDALEHFETRKQTLDYPTSPRIHFFKREIFEQKKLPTPKTPDVIFHLGACTDTTQLNEDYLTKWNLDYSKNVWNFCTQHKIPMFYASSAATYGDGTLGYDDDESLMNQLKPLNPYGWSKLNFDLWALDQESKGVAPPQWAGFKFFNVYGPGEAHKGKMASVVWHGYNQIKAQGRIKLFESHKTGIRHGEQKRDFIFVGDVVEVLWHFFENKIKRGIFNLGSGTARSFNDLANGVFRKLNLEAKIEYIPTPESLRERYQYFTEANMKKLQNQGYQKPFLSLEDGISEYLDSLS